MNDCISWERKGPERLSNWPRSHSSQGQSQDSDPRGQLGASHPISQGAEALANMVTGRHSKGSVRAPAEHPAGPGMTGLFGDRCWGPSGDEARGPRVQGDHPAWSVGLGPGRAVGHRPHQRGRRGPGRPAEQTARPPQRANVASSPQDTPREILGTGPHSCDCSVGRPPAVWRGLKTLRQPGHASGRAVPG